MKHMARHGLILGGICLAATGLLASVNLFTAPYISQQAQAELQTSFKDVFPQAERFEAAENGDYFRAYTADGKLLGAAFIAEKKGYSSQIQTLVGLLVDGTINAVKVLSQNETPGLGTRIIETKDDFTVADLFKGRKKSGQAKPWFAEQFCGKALGQLNEVQAITGATVSSSAVIESVKEKAKLIKEELDHGG